MSSIQMRLEWMILPTPTSLFIALTVTLKSTDDGRLKTKLYHKCDDFQIFTFPIISSNILASPAYGVILGSVHNAVILWRELSCWHKRYLNKATLLIGWSHRYKKNYGLHQNLGDVTKYPYLKWQRIFSILRK